MSEATEFQAIKGEGGEAQLGEGDAPVFILPEGPDRPPRPPAPPFPIVVAQCPGVECCDISPFVYNIPRIPPTLGIGTTGGGDSECSTCLNGAFSSYITADGIGVALTWTIESGSLPPGLTFHGGYNEEGRVLIDGTPTSAGNYSITVKALAPSGAFVTGVFPFNVFGISTSSLPAYDIDVFYYFQLTATGGSGNYGWSIDSGSLPDGLILDPIQGVIYGTPTGLNSGDQPIVFKVVDITCEQFNPVFVPQARISAASSNTKIATVLGYDEFIPSTPPKRYHTATWAGHSEQQLWVGGDGSPYTPPVTTQIGGARYDYSGADHVDTNGNVDATHVKNYSVECNGDSAGIYADILGNTTSLEYFPYNFKGYYGLAGGSAPEFLGHPTVLCGSPSLPYSFVADVAVAGTRDSSNLWGSRLISGSINLGISNFVVASSTVAQSVETGTDSRLVQRYLPVIGVGGSAIFPPDYWIGGSIIYDNNYSCTLSDEYTDAEALANATSIISNSRTAENLPRTTGFVSRFTTVNYDITCSNLVVGSSYRLTIQFVETSTGTVTTQSETFVATSTTQVINHNTPNPDAGHTLTVTNPTITFA